MRLKFVKADQEGNRRLITVNGEGSIRFACQFLALLYLGIFNTGTCKFLL